MISFEWTAAYSVGDDRIDDQHKLLMHLMNEYYLSQLSGLPARAQACLSRLLAQVVGHFREEEEMMERTGYPRFKEHRKQHHRPRAAPSLTASSAASAPIPRSDD